MSRGPDLTRCDRCRADTTRTAAGRCTVCLSREAGKERRRRKAKAEAADRERLGLHPATRGKALVRISVDAAVHWSEVSRRAGAPVPDAVARHLEAARRELEP